MPMIICSRCGASIFALMVGHNLDVRGGNDFRCCRALANETDDEISIDLVLECDDMERAIQQSMKDLSDTDIPVNLIWPIDWGDNRGYERWEPLSGVLNVDNHQHQCVVLNISPGGASVWGETMVDIPDGANLAFEPDGHNCLPAEVARRKGRTLGLKFMLSAEQRSDMAEWLMRLRHPVNTTQ